MNRKLINLFISILLLSKLTEINRKGLASSSIIYGGCTDYLQKPINFNNLISAIGIVLDMMSETSKIKRIAVIGNSGGGKTTLSRALQRIHQLPLHHVDAIQFTAGMKIRNHSESIAVLNEIQMQESWIIDGYGPLDILESRLKQADIIVFIDFPFQKHVFWSLKRQLKLFFTRTQRSELPSDCFEGTWAQTQRLLKSLRNVHYKMRPELLRILRRDYLKQKVIYVVTQRHWDEIFIKGVATAAISG